MNLLESLVRALRGRSTGAFELTRVVRGRRVAWEAAYPMKRARKAAGVSGRKASKRFYRDYRSAATS